MSGHSKWHSIKHKKGALDAKRGKTFTKIIREITVAAKMGGGLPENNPRLRLAINNAKSNNMPSDNVERAIKKGTGELEGVTYEEIVYEGYGPEGVAILVKCLTDNKNRTSSEVRNIFAKNNGNMAGAGSVAWMFEMKGVILVDASKVQEDKLFEVISEAGAEDMSRQGEQFEVITEITAFDKVRTQITGAGIPVENAELTMVPKNFSTLSVESARKVLSLLELLEDHDDVQNVYSNLDIPEDLMKEVS